MKKRKVITIISLIVIIVVIGIVYYRYYFVFGEGVKAGQLNYFVKKGYMFKTYEGKMIQAGLKTQVAGSIASNEFMFSVTSDSVAAKLNRNAGSFLEVHYREYLHTLPWRGFSNFVVDSVITATPVNK
jgi:Tfp pilus assembly major pilin PilA